MSGPILLALALSGPSITTPDWAVWDATPNELEALAARLCVRHKTRKISPPFLNNVRVQAQIDCHGVEFWGARRYAEFVIGDGRLEMVWIAIDAAERGRAGAEMAAAYGPPTARREDISGHPAQRTALRKKPPEILFYSPRQAAEWDAWFGQQSQKHDVVLARKVRTCACSVSGRSST